MLERQITCFVTTHHPELKAFSYHHPGVRNASVEFDLETLSPTYRLIVGLPGRSNALAIATRLGLPAPILESARTMVTTEDLAVDDLLDEIQKSRDDIRLSLERIRQQEAETLERERELATRLEAIENERHQVVREIEQQAQTELDELRREIRRLRRQLEGAGQPLDAIRQLQKTADLIQPQDYLSVPETETGDEGDQVTGHRFRLNETVWVPSLNSEGQIAEITEDELEIAVGRLRIRAKPTEVEQLSRQERKQARRKQQRTAADRPASGTQLPERGASPGLELDLRGNRVEEAITRVEEYLDAAYMAQLPFVRIIHGKGTGALRQAVRNELSQHPLVSKYMSGNEKEGGTGVTIVHLVTQH
jgi:DNA mismatch repair protein MutS2